ncbi:MAG: hypothetical protein R2825_22000 [Saprospiraceae bacterium]
MSTRQRPSWTFSAMPPSPYKIISSTGPVVNEYVEMLWGMPVYLGVEEVRRERKYQVYLTHDVDAALLRPNLFVFIKIGGDLLKRKSTSLTVTSFTDYLNFSLKKGKTLRHLRLFHGDSRKAGLQAHFYFSLSGGSKTL